MLALRRQVQAARSPDATDIDALSSGIHFEGFDHPVMTRVANPLLDVYWRMTRRLAGARGALD